MKLFDLFEEDEESAPSNTPTPRGETAGYQSPEDDALGAVNKDSVYVPKMTLKMINSMKKVMIAKQQEAEKRQELMAIMYAASSSEEM